MLDDKRFDFSEESNIKENLWQKMLEKLEMSKAAPVREEIALDSLLSNPKTAPEKGRQTEKTPKDPGRKPK
jgi:hypothetical protein